MIAGIACPDDDHAAKAAQVLHDRAGVDTVVLARGAQGATVFAPGESGDPISHVATSALEVFDVSEAGDTVVAALALASPAAPPFKPPRE